VPNTVAFIAGVGPATGPAGGAMLAIAPEIRELFARISQMEPGDAAREIASVAGYHTPRVIEIMLDLDSLGLPWKTTRAIRKVMGL
jgi:hypothetical protein